MPGIVGIISARPPEECHHLVKTMVTSMEHERFYRSGTYCVPEMGVYVGWIALEDAVAGNHAVFDEERGVGVVFAGECFQDCDGSESSGAGWMLDRYRAQDERFVERLNGFFSGVLVDRKLRKMFLFNDRYGFERIYIHEAVDALYFASEAKALLRILPVLRSFDDQGVAQLVAFGCTLERQTLFRKMSLLPGGSLWAFQNGGVRKQTYFSSNVWEAQQVLTSELFERKFAETFEAVLPRYCGSESRIGISLTGGLDTRMIMTCLPRLIHNPTCYTFSGQDGKTLDDRLAARVAGACGLEHHLLRIGPDFLSDFASNADRTVYITDGCLGILGAHEIYLNRLARELAFIRLTGVFGGEIFRKVLRFKPVRLSAGLLVDEARERVEACIEEVVRGKSHPVTFSAFKYVPSIMFGVVAASRSQVAFRTPYMDNDLAALAYRAPEDGRTSRHWIRAINQKHRALSQIPTDMGLLGKTQGIGSIVDKSFSRFAFKLDYTYSEGMPHWMSRFDAVCYHLGAVTGVLGSYKYLRYRSWFRHELHPYVSEALNASTVAQEGIWNGAFVKNMARQHGTGHRNYVTEINAVLTLDAVRRLLFQF